VKSSKRKTEGIPKRILIVEDDRDMQEYYEYIFRNERKRYVVDVVGDPVSATEQLKKRTYDLFIVDIIMERMPGDVFIANIKKDRKTKEIPVLVVSVLEPDTLEELSKKKRVYFLPKPITKRQLLSKIRELL
jgi:CheY-like chemotaxis protein